jgi:hypothetical protein
MREIRVKYEGNKGEIWRNMIKYARVELEIELIIIQGLKNHQSLKDIRVIRVIGLLALLGLLG